MLAAGVAAAFCLTPWGRALDFVAYDSLFYIRGKQPLPNEIVFVAIDEPSFQEVGLQWPWPRSLHAKLIASLYGAGANTVAVDILFPEPSAPDEDAVLAEVLDRYGPTVLAVDINRSEDNRFELENLVEPLALFQTPNTVIGHIRTPTDSDGFVRRTDLELRDFPSLGYAAALSHTDGKCCRPLPDAELPFINFSGGPETLQTISYYQALDPARYLPDDALRGKLVIVGVSTQSIAMPNERRPDHFPTPFTRWGEGYASGSLVHANVAANLLEKRFIDSVSIVVAAAMGFILATIFGVVTFKLGFRSSSAIAGGLMLVLLLTSYALFTQQLLYLSPTALVLPLLAAYLFSPYYRYLGEARQRALIRKAFSTYVNPEIVSQLEKDPDSVKLGGKQVDGSALFLDIAGFTSLSERHDPETVVEFINDFLSALIEIAMDNGGTVERFLGDAIMVIWGAPVAQTDHAQLACQTAVGMALEIQRISENESDRLGGPVRARIGINSGSMTAGNIGANRRFNYTVLGDCVNLAARLEGLNKIYRTTVIIGSETAVQLKSDFVLRYLDTVTVKGRVQPEKIFELLGFSGEVSEGKLKAADAYARGMTFYQQRIWAEASRCYAEGLSADSTDGPCAVLKARCDAYAADEPVAEWNGVFDIDTK